MYGVCLVYGCEWHLNAIQIQQQEEQREHEEELFEEDNSLVDLFLDLTNSGLPPETDDEDEQEEFDDSDDDDYEGGW